MNIMQVPQISSHGTSFIPPKRNKRLHNALPDAEQHEKLSKEMTLMEGNLIWSRIEALKPARHSFSDL